jgi:hypothetical protein
MLTKESGSLGLRHSEINHLPHRRHRPTRVRPPCAFVLEFFRGQRIRHVPGLGDHLVAEGLAVPFG